MMKSPSKLAAVVGILGAASLAAAQDSPLCAITTFQKVVTLYPPLDCTEPDMYHCFCKITSLQQHFVDYAYADCPSESEAKQAVSFGVSLCEQLGLPITVPAAQPITTSSPAPEPTSPPKAPASFKPQKSPKPYHSGSFVPHKTRTRTYTKTHTKTRTGSVAPYGTGEPCPPEEEGPKYSGKPIKYGGEKEKPAKITPIPSPTKPSTPVTVNAAGLNAPSVLALIACIAASLL